MVGEHGHNMDTTWTQHEPFAPCLVGHRYPASPGLHPRMWIGYASAMMSGRLGISTCIGKHHVQRCQRSTSSKALVRTRQVKASQGKSRQVKASQGKAAKHCSNYACSILYSIIYCSIYYARVSYTHSRDYGFTERVCVCVCVWIQRYLTM